MKIKVKRYKEIEKIALSEALVKVLNEIAPGDPKLSALETALKALQLKPNEYSKILGYVEGVLSNKGVRI